MAISASTWKSHNMIGLNQAIEDTSTTQNHPLGFRVRCVDVSTADRGYGEFIYLKGVASTVAGDCVVYDLSTALTTRTVAASKGQVGVAMSANAATTSYGWYQVDGVAVVTVGTVSDNGQVYTTSSDGSLDDAQVDGNQIFGATFRSATDTGVATMEVHFPFAGADDQVT